VRLAVDSYVDDDDNNINKFIISIQYTNKQDTKLPHSYPSGTNFSLSLLESEMFLVTAVVWA
jgi:hypothetical protein